MRATPISPHGANAWGPSERNIGGSPPTGGVYQRHSPPNALPQRAVVAIRRQQIERPTRRLVSSVGRKLSVRKRTPQIAWPTLGGSAAAYTNRSVQGR